jgi:mannosyltransferase
VNVAVDSARVADMVRVRGSGRADSILIGLLAFVVSIAGAGRPSLWLDEAATISGSTRSLPQMWSLLGQVDGVHGLYYLLMHGWFAIFPVTEFWARVPSALLIGGAAAGVVVLGRQLSTRSVAIAAGVVFAVLPRTTWAGIEARPYALSIFDAVWLTVLCVAAVRSGRSWLWCAYAGFLALAAIGNVFVVFVVIAHVVLVAACAGGTRRTVAVWLSSATVAAVAVVPFLLAVKAQQSQVAWIWPVGPGTLGQFLGDQYFPVAYSDGARSTGLGQQEIASEQVAAALHAWALVAPFIVVVGVLAVAARRTRGRPAEVAGDDVRLLVWTAAAWILGPTAALVGYSLIGEPMYQPHYLAFTAPALALLIGLCVAVVGREPRRIAVILAVLVVAAVPNYVAQRGPYAKFGQDYSQVADLIEAQAGRGECLNIDDTMPSTVFDTLKVGRAGSYAALRDPGEVRSAVDRDMLVESRVPIVQWIDDLRTCPALWTITERDRTLPAHERGEHLAHGPRLAGVTAQRVPNSLGFRLVERWQFNVTQVVRSVPPVG